MPRASWGGAAGRRAGPAPARPPAQASGPVAAPVAAPVPPSLDDTARAALLRVARLGLAYAVGAAPEAALEAAVAAAIGAAPPAAVFVTLTEFDELRACMGNLDTSSPLAETVAAAAITAASHDPRFMPISARELPSIHLEVSVLGESLPLLDPAAFRSGIDGVVVARRGRRALLLPEVATDQGWGAEEMLDALCRKAGLPRDAWREAWRDGETELVRFCTVRFGGQAADRG